MRSASRSRACPASTPQPGDVRRWRRISTASGACPRPTCATAPCMSGIWEVGGGFQVSGTHYMALGQRAQTIYGGDLRNLGGSDTSIQRLRPNGTIVPRNAFTQPARNRTAVRLQQRISLPARVSMDLIAEAFNVFNNTNVTISTQENNALYLKPTSGEFRTMQVGFRLTF